MKLTINNKIFIGKYDENNRLIIPLDNDLDKHFFKKWQDKSKSGYKKDYVENVNFAKVTEQGTLINCFPILSNNEDSVELVYDTIRIIQHENKIIVGDKTFEFKLPEDLNTHPFLRDWCKLIEKQKNNEDVWMTIPQFPQYEFKNLSIECSPFEIKDENVEMTITLKYDEYKEVSK